jgi:hypothetical protein
VDAVVLASIDRAADDVDARATDARLAGVGGSDAFEPPPQLVTATIVRTVPIRARLRRARGHAMRALEQRSERNM